MNGDEWTEPEDGEEKSLFRLSGFSQDEADDISYRTKLMRQIAKEQKAERRAQRQTMNNYRKRHVSAGLQALIKAQRNMTHDQKKNKMQKTTEQIQYGYAIAAWWRLQHA